MRYRCVISIGFVAFVRYRIYRKRYLAFVACDKCNRMRSHIAFLACMCTLDKNLLDMTVWCLKTFWEFFRRDEKLVQVQVFLHDIFEHIFFQYCFSISHKKNHGGILILCRRPQNLLFSLKCEGKREKTFLLNKNKCQNLWGICVEKF